MNSYIFCLNIQFAHLVFHENLLDFSTISNGFLKVIWDDIIDTNF